jgi:hypothetical protein
VSRHHLVFGVAPAFAGVERREARVVFQGGDFVFDFLQAEVADEVGETLVEPEVVPPFHGDEVSEPVVGQFVGYRVGDIEHLLV